MINRYRIRHHRIWPLVAIDRARMGLTAWQDRSVEPIPQPLASCFVVGCGNSGTTLVAARIGVHPLVQLIPKETRLFLPNRRLARARELLVDQMHRARSAGATLLVEKTPKHVHVVDRIRRLLPDARIVVVVRNPLDTCLSIKKRFGRLDYAIERWLIDNREALRLRDERGCTTVVYDRLTEAPEPELRRVLAFLDLPWDAEVLHAERTGYGDIDHRTPTMRLRAEQVRRPIRPNSGRWRTELGTDEIRRVRDATDALWQRLTAPA